MRVRKSPPTDTEQPRHYVFIANFMRRSLTSIDGRAPAARGGAISGAVAEAFGGGVVGAG